MFRGGIINVLLHTLFQVVIQTVFDNLIINVSCVIVKLQTYQPVSVIWRSHNEENIAHHLSNQFIDLISKIYLIYFFSFLPFSEIARNKQILCGFHGYISRAYLFGWESGYFCTKKPQLKSKTESENWTYCVSHLFHTLKLQLFLFLFVRK